MKCGICASSQREADAVAICNRCSIGLCLSHLAEAQTQTGPGGLAYGCNHQAVLQTIAQSHVAAPTAQRLAPKTP
jgi:hypothetical protein